VLVRIFKGMLPREATSTSPLSTNELIFQDADASAFSPDGHFFAARNGVVLWDLSSPNAAKVSLPASLGGRVRFSSDNKWLLSIGTSSVQIFPVERGKAGAHPFTLLSGGAPVRAAAFSPDGRWLAAGGEDSYVRLWNLQEPTAQPIVLVGHDKPIEHIDFDAEPTIGQWLITRDATAILCWRLETERMIEEARARASRNFTPEERSQYFPP
jgi:WD40 repeat protein